MSGNFLRIVCNVKEQKRMRKFCVGKKEKTQTEQITELNTKYYSFKSLVSV